MFLFSSTPQTVITRAIAAGQRYRACSAEIHFDAKIGDKTIRSTYKVNVDGKKWITLRIQDEARGAVAASDRIYHVEGHHLTAYDYVTSETLKRDLAGGKVSDELRAVMGSEPDPVAIVVDSNYLNHIWQSMGKGGRFQAMSESTGEALERHSSYPVANSFVRMTFSREGLIYSFLASSPRAHYHWTISYSHQIEKYRTPANATVVSSFHERQKPPHYADAAAHALTRSMLRAEKGLGPTRIRVTRDDGETTIYWDNGQIRGGSDAAKWAYDGSVLTVEANGSFYRGKASRADSLDYLSALTNGTDPLARELILRATPFLDFFQPGAKVRIAGKMRVAGQDVSILQVDGAGLRSSIYVRQSDNLVAGVDSDNLDQSGKVALHEHTSFRYSPLDEGTISFALKPRSGEAIQKLPKSALKMSTH